MALRHSRLAFALATVAAAAAVAVPTAGAKSTLLGLGGSNCPSGGSQVFASWGDSADYYLAPNGGLESGSNGWTLSGGASIVSGNEPFFASGSHSLSLPSGSSATSPLLCIDKNEPYVRLFGVDAGGSDAGLHVRVMWYGLLNTLLGVTDVATYAPNQQWNALNELSSAGGFNLLLPLVGSTSAKIVITPVGSGSHWQVDDLYIDPFGAR